MTCPNCQSEFDAPLASCPDCGIQIARKITGILKTSTILIGTDCVDGVFRSVQDVPEPLRTRLLESTSGENSGTIVIADREGRRQWTEIVAHRENVAAMRGEHQPAAREPENDPPVTPRRPLAKVSWAAWAGILLFLAAAVLISSVFHIIHW